MYSFDCESFCYLVNLGKLSACIPLTLIWLSFLSHYPTSIPLSIQITTVTKLIHLWFARSQLSKRLGFGFLIESNGFHLHNDCASFLQVSDWHWSLEKEELLFSMVVWRYNLGFKSWELQELVFFLKVETRKDTGDYPI